MPTVFRLLDAGRQFLDDNGAVLNGGKLFTYTPGTTTKKTAYTDSGGGTAETNPVVLDSAGRIGNALWGTTGGYKVVLAPSTDTDPPTSAIWTEDSHSLINDTSPTTVNSGDSGATADTTADDFTVESSGNGGMSVMTPDANTGSYLMGSPSDASGVAWTWNHDSNLAQFGTKKASAILDLLGDNGTTILSLSTFADFHGKELVLDTDGDTSITADTDDQIDFRTGGSDRMVLDASGRLVVGHTAALTVGDNTGSFQFTGTDAPTSQLSLAAFNTTDALQPELAFLKSGDATPGSNTSIATSESVGKISWRADDGGDYVSEVASICVFATGTIGASQTPGLMALRVTPEGSDAATSVLTLDRGQNVLLGTGALATSATDGFLYITAMPGAPSGTPTTYNGRSAIVHDTTNNRIYLYDEVSNAWQFAALT